MGNLLALYEFDMATVRITENNYQYLFDGTDISYRVKKIKEVVSEDLAWSDVVFLIRPCDYSSLMIARKARKYSKRVICCWDDDVLLLPDDSMLSNPLRKKLIIRIMRNSNAISSCNARIVNKYKYLTVDKSGFLGDTIVSEEEIDCIPIVKNNKITKIVYAAGASHEDLYNKYVAPTIENLFDKYKDKLQLDFVGVRPTIPNSLAKYNVNFINAMPLKEYREFMIAQKYDIGLSPIENTEFFNSKYFNKFIEYSIVGAVGVYSNCDPYTQIVVDEENGLLANNTPLEWEKAIDKLIQNNVLRKKCLQGSIDSIKNRLSKEVQLNSIIKNVWELNCPHIDDNKRYNLIIPHLMANLFKYSDLFVATMWYIRNKGFSETYRKVVVHFKSKFSKK